MTKGGFGLALAVALVAASACSDSSASKAPAAPGDRVASGRWYGKITVDARAHTREMLEPGNGITQSVDDDTRTTTVIDVTAEGKRMMNIDATWVHRQSNRIESPCYIQHATAYALAKGTSDGSSLSGAAPSGTAPPIPELPPGTELPPGWTLPPGTPPGGAFPLPDASISGAAGSYFALEPEGDGGFRLAEDETSRMLIAHGTGTTRQVFATCDTSGDDEREDKIDQTIDVRLPLDRVRGALDPKKKSAEGSLTFDDGNVKYRVRWTLKRDPDVVAIVGGPYSVTRGGRVTLDASKSRGDIETYEWKLSPGLDCIRAEPVQLIPGRDVQKSGKTISFIALCPVDVTLTVKGGAARDSDDGEVKVTPREGWRVKWKDPFVEHTDINSAYGGANECALEDAGETTGHYLHQTPTDRGFTVKTVSDPDGPFDGNVYLEDPTLTIARRERVERAYKPATPGVPPEAEGLVHMNTASPFDDQLYQQIRAHEAAHSALIQAWVQQHRGNRDPMRDLETVAAPDELRATSYAETILSAANKEICDGTKHELVFPRLSQFAGISGVAKASAQSIVATISDLQTFANDVLRCQ